MASTINIVYVDDRIDQALSRYLDSYANDRGADGFKYYEIHFEVGQSYESLLRDERIRTASILLIDSALFENASATTGKFTGEEFRVILSKVYPYIEVIVISQNVLDVHNCVVAKCKGERLYRKISDYYDKQLMPLLKEKHSKILETRTIIERLSYSSIDKMLLEKIQNIAAGNTEYDELKVSDIDQLVQLFQSIEAKG